jgi:hypothetical protein
MADREEASGGFDHVLGRNPKEYPFGFFLREDIPFGSAYFHWHDGEESLLNEIRQDLAGFFPEDGEKRYAEIRSELSTIIDGIAVRPKLGEALRERLDEYFTGVASIEWLGTFEQLCKGNDDAAKDFRNQYRKAHRDDFDDLSMEERESPINAAEVDSFAEYVSEYGM